MYGRAGSDSGEYPIFLVKNLAHSIKEKEQACPSRRVSHRTLRPRILCALQAGLPAHLEGHVMQSLVENL